MLHKREWILIVTAAHSDGSMFLFEPLSGAHAQVRELVDSHLALLEFTLVVPRHQAEELRDTLSLSELNRQSAGVAVLPVD